MMLFCREETSILQISNMFEIREQIKELALTGQKSVPSRCTALSANSEYANINITVLQKQGITQPHALSGENSTQVSSTGFLDIFILLNHFCMFF